MIFVNRINSLRRHFGAVLASLPAVSRRMVVFDTSMVDLTEELDDPVDLLFGTQSGGGTDTHQVLAYCQKLVLRPEETILILLSDLLDGGAERRCCGGLDRWPPAESK